MPIMIRDDPKKEPLLSVRLMTYNHGQFIAAALDNVLKQKTNFDFEVLIGDDFSTDDTLSICKTYQEKFPDKVRILKREKGDAYDTVRQEKGRLYNFANIFANCRGKYVALLDGDDFWNDEYQLQKQLDFLENNADFVLCYHDFNSINEKDEYVENTTLQSNKDYDAKTLQKGMIILPLTLCCRNVIDKFPEEFYNSNNGDSFLISMLGVNGGAKYLGNDIQPASYRVHGSGVWSSTNKIDKFYKSFISYKNLYLFHKREGRKDISSAMAEKMEDYLSWLLIESVNTKNPSYFFKLASEFFSLFLIKPKKSNLSNAIRSCWYSLTIKLN
ncbi:MAG: glycosyltransferase involved in cell wall biosynthesis [Chitinophagales bacterium]|jgi:glycosyltransferase involved in cell wall biosynthesis